MSPVKNLSRNDRGRRRVAPFDWSGGHPALDYVNTLDERPSDVPIERLLSYRDLVTFAEAAGLIDRRIGARLLRIDSRFGLRVVARARALREHFHDVLAAAHLGRAARRPDLGAISSAIRAAHAARTLASSTAAAFARYEWSMSSPADIPLHACALAIERLLVEEDRGRIRKCGAFDCDVYFIDTSKGRRRHWCTMRGCGNREKQRRWRVQVG